MNDHEKNDRKSRKRIEVLTEKSWCKKVGNICEIYDDDGDHPLWRAASHSENLCDMQTTENISENNESSQEIVKEKIVQEQEQKEIQNVDEKDQNIS